jgi:hypothetical protein
MQTTAAIESESLGICLQLIIAVFVRKTVSSGQLVGNGSHARKWLHLRRKILSLKITFHLCAQTKAGWEVMRRLSSTSTLSQLLCIWLFTWIRAVRRVGVDIIYRNTLELCKSSLQPFSISLSLLLSRSPCLRDRERAHQSSLDPARSTCDISVLASRFG